MSLYDDASLIMYPSGVKSGKIYSQKPTDGTGDLTFTRASTATRVNSSGLIEDVASGVPRIDYTGGGCGRLLLEPQRTNKSNNSEDWTSYTKNNCTVIVNQAVSPDGTTTADQLDFGSGSGYFYESATTITAASTYSVFVKYIDYQYIQIIGTGDGNHYANFDIQNGAIGNVGSEATASIEDYGNGWYRCIINYYTGTFSGTARVYKVSSLTAGYASGGGGAGSFYFWGNQMEVGSYPTSYIPTSGAAVTRVADDANLLNINSNLPVGTSYTLYCNYAFYAPISGSTNRDWRTTTNGNLYLIYYYGGGLNVYNGSAFIMDRTVKVSNENFKLAIVCTSTTVKVFVNGVNKTLGGATPNTSTLGQFRMPTTNDNAKHLRELVHINRALSDAEAIELTTI